MTDTDTQFETVYLIVARTLTVRFCITVAFRQYHGSHAMPSTNQIQPA